MRPAILSRGFLLVAALCLCASMAAAQLDDGELPTDTNTPTTLEEVIDLVVRLRVAVRRLKRDLNATQLQLNVTQLELDATNSQLQATTNELTNTKNQLLATQIELSSTSAILNSTSSELDALKTELDNAQSIDPSTARAFPADYFDRSAFNYPQTTQGNAAFDSVRIGEWILEPEADKLVLRYNGTDKRSFYNGRRFAFAPNGDMWSGLFPHSDGIGYGDWVIHQLSEKWNRLVLNDSDVTFKSVRVGDYVMQVAEGLPQYLGFYLYGQKLIQFADNGDIWSALFPQPALNNLVNGDWMVTRLREHWNRLAFTALCDRDVFQARPTLDSARCFDFGSRGRTLCSNEWSRVQLVRNQQR